jgi:protein TonB
MHSKMINKIIIALFLMASSQRILAQDTNQPPVEEQIYEDSNVDVLPDFPGGMDTFYKQFNKNFTAPDVPGLVDKIVLSFTVEKDGTLANLQILHDAGFGTGEQAIRILESFPKWLPGTKDGKKVRVLHLLPIAIITE